MKKILVFGAGKSAFVLIEYLSQQLQENNWFLTVADYNLAFAQAAISDSEYTLAVAVNVKNEEERDNLIADANLVISLLPAEFHILIAKSCLKYSKNLLTASYLDEEIKSLQQEIESKGLLFLGEMGLDPGIDHMSAMRLIQDIQSEGGEVNSFYSHCGGLISPQSDDNPWHYKISWNPRNVVNAGKAGATYLQEGKTITEIYPDLFDAGRKVSIGNDMEYAWYPNRNSLPYIDLYNLNGVSNFIRTTLRHPEFIFGWKNLIDLKLTEEIGEYDTDGMSLKDFFSLHFENNNFSEWISRSLTGKMEKTKELLENLTGIIEMQQDEKNTVEDIMMVDGTGELKDLSIDEIKLNAAKTAATQMTEARLMIQQLAWLGISDSETIINKGKCTAADVLLFILEEKLKIKSTDKDMILMLHQLEFEQDGVQMAVDSSLVVYGEDNKRTAMAKTVGLPLAIAASLILKGKINLTGLHIPIKPEIYIPVLNELEKNNVVFEERIRHISS